jgi:hypothetical protein
MGAVCTNCRDTKEQEQGNEIESHIYNRDSTFGMTRSSNYQVENDNGGKGLYVKAINKPEIGIIT